MDRFVLDVGDMSAPVDLGRPLPGNDPFPPSRFIAGLSKLPASTLASLYWRIVGERSVAFCVHRVHDGERRPGELQPWLSVDERTLDALLTHLLDARLPRSGRLTLTFDDGYLDACRYVASRAPRFADVEFLFFICTDKTVRRRGFRWDAYELARHDPSWSSLQRHLLTAVPPHEESAAEELAGLADHPAFALASVEQCKALALLPNVRLGNHSDQHLCAATLSLDELRREIRCSVESFTAVFGETHDFAFPFGTPGLHFGPEQARVIADETRSVLWSTEPRPYLARERWVGAVVPRVPVLGTWTLTETLASLVTTSLRAWTRGYKTRLKLNEAALARAVSASRPAARPRPRAVVAPALPPLPGP